VRKAIALLAALVSTTSGTTSWPSPKFPQRSENASATRLLATVERFGDDLLTIRRGQVPPGFLEKHANTIRTLRAQIISNEPPVWALDIEDILQPPSPPLLTHLRLFSLLGADALAQKNAAAAWADLHAIWILSRSLWQRPETMSMAIALRGSRTIAEVAPNIGPPMPEWWNEFASFDVRVPLLRAIEYEAFAMRLRAERYPLGEPDGSKFDDTVRGLAAPFVRPIRVAQSTIAIEKMHEITVAEMKADACRPFAVADMPEWSGFIRRFNEFRCSATR